MLQLREDAKLKKIIPTFKKYSKSSTKKL